MLLVICKKLVPADAGASENKCVILKRKHQMG